MAPNRDTHPVTLAGLRRELPLFEVKPGLRIAVLNILGDTELVEACSSALADRLQQLDYDVLVTAEAKSIPLVHSLSASTGRPYVVLRKTYKLYMGVALSAETHSITTGQPQSLYLDEKDREILQGARALLVDDVISTGSTSRGMRRVMEKAGAEVVGEAAICTEGDRGEWAEVISLGHLPLFTD